MATPLCESCNERPADILLDDGARICRGCYERDLEPLESTVGQDRPGSIGEGAGERRSVAEDVRPRTDVAAVTPTCADCGLQPVHAHHGVYGTPLCVGCLAASEVALMAEKARMWALGAQATVNRRRATIAAPSDRVESVTSSTSAPEWVPQLPRGANEEPTKTADDARPRRRGSRRLGGLVGPDFAEQLPIKYRQLMEDLGHRPGRIETAAEFGVSLSTFDRARKLHEIPWPPA